MIPWDAEAQEILAKIQLIDGSGVVEDEFDQNFSNELELKKWEDAYLLDLWERGYGAASLKTRNDEAVVFVTVNKGFPIVWDVVNISSVSSRKRRQLRRVFDIKGNLVTQSSIFEVMREVLSLYENEGYPFASVHLDSLQLSSNGMVGKLVIEPGLFFRFFKLEIASDVKVNKAFLLRYLELRVGDEFNFDKIKAIKSKLSALPFITMNGDPSLSFSDEGKVRMWLDLKNEKISSFDGIIGVAPKTDNATKTLVTGQLDFRLRNPFSRGTSLDFSFEKFQEKAQKLHTKLQYPYVLSSPIGLGFQLDLQKLDTSYLSLETRTSISYFFSGASRVDFFYEPLRAYPLSKAPSVRSRFDDLKTINYGLAYSGRSLDYLPNPSKGWEFDVEISVGSKEIFLEERKEKSTIGKAGATLSYFLPIKGKLVLYSKSKGLYNQDSSFSQSQVKWIGGAKTLRGFNEGAIPTKSFVVQTVELRYLTDRDSHFKLFYDLGYMSSFSSLGNIENSTFSGVGAGFNFKSGPGIFSISYAVGKSKDLPFSLSGGKAHFGFLSYF